MQIRIIAIGRMKRGPETDLLDRYVTRARQQGRAVGFTQVDVDDLVEGRADATSTRKDDEAQRLLNAVPDDALLIALDERGTTISSKAFADMLSEARDDGVRSVAFIIGGPDGLADAIRHRAQRTISFGKMTLPHGLVRVVLAEQIYRAITILAGHPYHRE
ncbi:MAG: 23S rRNA (pseudouridine(1915)-N(3))-methyltransferase RlmH [Pseudomonadota bacterium]